MVCQCKIGLEPQRFIEVGEGAVVLAIVDEHIATIVERLGVVGIKLHGGVGVSKRSVEPAQVAVSVGSLAEGPRFCWIQHDGVIEVLQRKNLLMYQ